MKLIVIILHLIKNKPIYVLGLEKIDILKTHIKTNLVYGFNSFLSTGAPISFKQKNNRKF